MTLQRKILLSIIVMTAVILCMGAISLFESRQINSLSERTISLYSDNLAFENYSAALNRIYFSSHMTIHGDLVKSKELKKISLNEANEAITNLKTSKSENLAALQAADQKLRKAADELAEIADELEKATPENRAVLQRRIAAKFDEIEATHDFISLKEDIIAHSIKLSIAQMLKTRETQTKFFGILLPVICFVSLSLSLIFGIWFSKHVSSRLTHLILGAREVTKGNFVTVPANEKGDELNQLSLAFNKMVGEIWDSQVHLEQKIKARTLELEEIKEKAEVDANQLQTIFNSAAVGIVVIDDKQNIVVVNKAIQRMTGYTEEELCRKNIYDLTHPDDVKHTKDNLASAPEGAQYVQLKRYIRKDGTTLWIRLTASILSDNAKKFRGVGIIEDITAQREAEEIIKRQQQEIQNSAIENAHIAGMSEIATGVLHNVGNVLNSTNVGVEVIIQKLDRSAIEGFYKANELLKENLNGLANFFTENPKGKKLIDYYFVLADTLKIEFEYLKTETSDVMEKLQLIKDIINTQQTYAKGHAEFKEQVSLIEVIENALVMQSNALTRHDIKIVKKFSDVPHVVAQKAKLIHVVLNLIKNAKEAMSSWNNKEKIMTIEIGRNNSGKIFFSISDTGSGVAQENLDKIFNHGFTTKKTGHGFGLHFCANSATEMDAKISVSSDGIGKGTCFTMEFSERDMSLATA